MMVLKRFRGGRAAVALVALLSLALAVPAVAHVGDRSHTVHANGYPCSVTAFGPIFRFTSNGIMMRYGGGTSCRRSLGRRELTVDVQVRGAHGRWFNINGAHLQAGPTTHSPLRLFASRPALLGHVYRTKAAAFMVVPNGHAGCSLHQPPDCNQTIVLTSFTAPIAP
jgi:hypothetical protein